MNNQINYEQNMGNCKRCGDYDELIHGEVCDDCVTDGDLQKWEDELTRCVRCEEPLYDKVGLDNICDVCLGGED